MEKKMKVYASFEKDSIVFQEIVDGIVESENEIKYNDIGSIATHEIWEILKKSAINTAKTHMELKKKWSLFLFYLIFYSNLNGKLIGFSVSGM